jgi:DNA mismatch endonuclease (patch repair protein)
MDVLTETQRHGCMAAIRNKDTKPELIVRRLVHVLGYRFRLHRAGLPGRPDLVFVANRKIIFVHGCFWHRHSCSKGRSIPATRKQFWRRKLEGNRLRDKDNQRKLRQLGWKVLVVWECWTRDVTRLEKRLRSLLEEA